MHDRLVDVLDRLDATLAQSRDFVPEGALDPMAIMAAKIRNRLDYPLDLALVAIAGGTGSGKSSLFNALLGGERAEVGGLRPTTSRALVSVPADRQGEIRGYIESLGDLDTSTHDGIPWLALIDLPDTDSVEVDHRLVVANLLPKVDAVVWLVDIEKYRDRSLHHNYLRPLCSYEGQFLFVINQIDRVPQAEVPALAADFQEALVEDGYLAPEIHTIAAGPMLSSPQGIEGLLDALRGRADGLAVDRMLADLDAAVNDLQTHLGDPTADFESRWQATLEEATTRAGEGDIVAGSRVLADFFLDIADGQSGKGAEESMSVAAHAAETLGETHREAVAKFPPSIAREGRRRFGRSTGIDTADSERQTWLRNRIDELTADRIRPFLRGRGVARANLAGLAVDVAALRHDVE